MGKTRNESWREPSLSGVRFGRQDALIFSLSFLYSLWGRFSIVVFSERVGETEEIDRNLARLAFGRAFVLAHSLRSVSAGPIPDGSTPVGSIIHRVTDYVRQRE